MEDKFVHVRFCLHRHYSFAAVQDTDFRQERLYFFQFPSPFPTFLPKPSATPGATPIIVDEPTAGDIVTSPPKKVSFAADVKPSSVTSSRPTSAAPEAGPNSDANLTVLDGVIGQLEVYQSGAVKMRLEGGIVLDVSVTYVNLQSFIVTEV